MKSFEVFTCSTGKQRHWIQRFEILQFRRRALRQRHFDEQKDADNGRQHRGRSRRRVAAAAATAGQAAVLAWWTGRRGRGVDSSRCVGRQCYRLHLVLRRLRFTHGGRQPTSSHRRRRRPLPEYLASMLVKTTDRWFGGQQVKVIRPYQTQNAPQTDGYPFFTLR